MKKLFLIAFVLIIIALILFFTPISVLKISDNIIAPVNKNHVESELGDDGLTESNNKARESSGRSSEVDAKCGKDEKCSDDNQSKSTKNASSVYKNYGDSIR